MKSENNDGSADSVQSRLKEAERVLEEIWKRQGKAPTLPQEHHEAMFRNLMRGSRSK